MSIKARRGVLIETNGTLEDIDRHADDLLTLGVYEATLEQALLHTEKVPVSALLRNRLSQDGLHIR